MTPSSPLACRATTQTTATRHGGMAGALRSWATPLGRGLRPVVLSPIAFSLTGPMRSLIFGTLATTVLSACSLFGPNVESLELTTLLQGSSLATTDLESPVLPFAPFITSLGEEEGFRTRYEISEPFPETNYSTDMLVAVVAPSTASNPSVTIEAVELIGDDQATVTYTVSGVSAGGATRYPLHVVRVQRSNLERRSIQTVASSPSRGSNS